jgi:hypothetical protein
MSKGLGKVQGKDPFELPDSGDPTDPFSKAFDPEARKPPPKRGPSRD